MVPQVGSQSGYGGSQHGLLQCTPIVVAGVGISVGVCIGARDGSSVVGGSVVGVPVGVPVGAGVGSSVGVGIGTAIRSLQAAADVARHLQAIFATN